MDQPFWRAGPRRIVAGSIVLFVSLVVSHVAATGVRLLWSVEAEQWAPAGARLSCAAAILGLVVSGLAHKKKQGLLGSLLAGAALGWFVAAGEPWPWQPGLVLVPLALGLFGLHARLMERLPRRLDEDARRHPRSSLLWVIVAALALIQMGRLATFMTNPESNWFLSTTDPFFAKHECANAYVYAAELEARGEPNIYDPEHYPGLNPKAEPHTEMSNMKVEDPFLYPPPFLLLPAAARLLTSDYQAIRVFWFGLNVLLCLSAVAALARWVGGRAGYLAGLASPLLLVAFPVLHDFQYGQFHFAAVALAMGALILFQKGRPGLGGLALAFAILAKLFPAILLIHMAFARRFRDLAWVASWGLLLCAVSLWCFGAEPFMAFAQFHVPRLRDGAAFAFGEAWPEVEHLVVAGNQGLAGVFAKVAFFGVSVPEWLIDASTLLYVAALAFSLALLGMRDSRLGRTEKAVVWLSVLGLASLLSRGAWSDYVPLTAVWLLCYLLGKLPHGTTARWLVILGSVFQLTLLGTMPLGSFQRPEVLVPLSMLGAVFLYSGFTWGLWSSWSKVRVATTVSDGDAAWRRETISSFGPESAPRSL